MHKDIWQIFLRIFDEGVLKTSNGKIIDFKNCVIILTSNLGSQKAQKKSIGIVANTQEEVSKNRSTEYAESIKKYFKPEVYNRISNIVVFHDLTKEDLYRIVELELKPITLKLKEKNLRLVVHKKTYDYFIENSDDKDGKLGARPIKRSIEKHLNDRLADIILENGDSIKTITISLKKGELTFTSK
jgi:ATP-dependent Clp protease ATP-binding subunit ClpC